jgi:hypothetical protein
MKLKSSLLCNMNTFYKQIPNSVRIFCLDIKTTGSTSRNPHYFTIPLIHAQCMKLKSSLLCNMNTFYKQQKHL